MLKFGKFRAGTGKVVLNSSQFGTKKERFPSPTKIYGSDGDSTVTYDFPLLNLHEKQEIVDPIIPAHPAVPTQPTNRRYFTSRAQISQEYWPEIFRRKQNGESLRELAKAYNVSYEAVRQVLLKVGQQDESS